MADLNLWVGTGHLGRDPEVKFMASGDAACNISIAVGKKWKDKSSGEMKEQTTWVPVAFFGKNAELVGKYCTKGSQIRVTGEFTVRKWTDKDGNDKYQTEIRASDMQLLGGKPDGGGQSAPAAAPRAAPQQRAASAPIPDDDIPF